MSRLRIPSYTRTYGQLTLTGEEAWYIELFKATLFALLTAFGATTSARLPWTPVPVTLQTFFVLLSGLTLRPREAILSQLEYLLAGVAGLPVFAEGRSGIGVLIGPTGGYLVGFVLSAGLVSLFRGFSRNPVRLLVSALLGSLVIDLCGMLWWTTGLHQPLWAAWSQAVQPFIAGDLIKTLAAVGIVVTQSQKAIK